MSKARLKSIQKRLDTLGVGGEWKLISLFDSVDGKDCMFWDSQEEYLRQIEGHVYLFDCPFKSDLSDHTGMMRMCVPSPIPQEDRDDRCCDDCEWCVIIHRSTS